jgi:hypothetical protein
MSIFEDEKKVVENTMESAKELGFNVPNMVKKKVMIANRKCKHCWGKGVITTSFPGNRGDETTYNVYCSCVKQKEIEVVDGAAEYRSSLTKKEIEAIYEKDSI